MFSEKLINRFKKIQTPFYYYNMGLLNETLQKLKKESDKYGYHVHFALKANANFKILKKIQTYGFGADCVSGNEVLMALKAGFDVSKIAFAGVGKNDQEIKTALHAGIFAFNSESLQEIEVINEFAKENKQVAPIAIRINPNVDAQTHEKITTGLKENKFGINLDEIQKVITLFKSKENIKLLGIHFHIGSQIRNLDVYKNLCFQVNYIQELFEKENIKLEHINVGGGLGINYENPDSEPIPDFESYFGVFNQYLKLRENQSLHFELGRSIIAQCGSLISKVLYVKEGENKDFVILDAGMTDLMRPALYSAVHYTENLTSTLNPKKYDIVGPICESSDVFSNNTGIREAKRGDLIAIRSTGAYGEVMTSAYNLRDFPKAYYSDEFFDE